MAWTALCQLDELTDGIGKFVEISGFQLAVFRDGENVHAIDNVCPHAGGPLVDGTVEDGCCVCPWHGWAFKLQTGELRDMPGMGVSSYRMRILHRDGHPPLVQADLPMP